MKTSTKLARKIAEKLVHLGRGESLTISRLENDKVVAGIAPTGGTSRKVRVFEPNPSNREDQKTMLNLPWSKKNRRVLERLLRSNRPVKLPQSYSPQSHNAMFRKYGLPFRILSTCPPRRQFRISVIPPSYLIYIVE